MSGEGTPPVWDEEDGPPPDEPRQAQPPPPPPPRPPRRTAAGGDSLPPSQPDRSPPHSAEAEEHVVAVCLLDNVDTIQRCKDEGLKSEMFYFPANRLLMEIIFEKFDDGEIVSLETLAEELKTRRQIEAVGGFAYLMQVTGKIPTTAHAGYFIEKVREKHQLRELIKISMGAIEQAYAFTGGMDELLEKTKKGMLEIEESGARLDVLAACEYDESKELKKPDTIFSLANTQICTPGNLTTIYSQAKVGKSALVGAIMAAGMAGPGTLHDTLNIKGSNTKKHALIHFDTEQSKYDRQQLIKTALARVGEAKKPAWLKSYLLTGKSAEDCRVLVERAIRAAKKKFGGIFGVIIDGTGDLVNNPNDEQECFPLVTRLHGLAIEFDTAIINILHLNPGATGVDAKGRGHLGSQLERKSESNLMLEKDNDVTVVYATKQRGRMIPKNKAPAFKWDDQRGMHVSIGTVDASEKKKGGGRPKTSFEEFISIFPKTQATAASLAELTRTANGKRPISKGALFTVINEAVQRGELMEDRSNPNRPKYWIDVPGEPGQTSLI